MNRVLAAGALELANTWRYGVVAVAAVLAVLWTGVTAALPGGAAAALAPLLLFVDTAGFGALFAIALLLFGRAEGTVAALAVTPLRPAESTAARIAVLTGLACAIAVPITVAARWDRPGSAAALGLAVAGVALTAVLLLAVCLALGGRARTLQGALLAVPPAVVPLIAVPMLHLSGAFQHPLLYTVPTTAGAELIRWGITGSGGAPHGAGFAAALAYALVCAGAAGWWAVRAAGTPSVAGSAGPAGPAGPADPSGRRPAVAGSGGGLHPVLRFARFDLTGARRDPLLAVIVCAPLLLALALRWGYPPVAEFVRDAHGFDPAAHAPALFGALVLLHVPTMVGTVAALRVIEDADDRTLLILRVSPLTLRSYFGYRAAVAAVLALAGLAVATPLSGLAPDTAPGLAAAVPLAALHAPLIMLLTAALAGNKVEALVVMKGVAALSVLVPALVWALPAPWWWPLLALPFTWPLLLVPGYPAVGLPVPAVLALGLLSAAATALPLLRRVRSRLHGP